jgi:hypothetical protein
MPFCMTSTATDDEMKVLPIEGFYHWKICASAQVVNELWLCMARFA